MSSEYCERCRRYRLILMVLLIVFAALAGYHWGSILDNAEEQVYQHDVVFAAVTSTLLALLVAVWSEVLVAKIEDAAGRALKQSDGHAEAALQGKKHVHELERIVTMLSDDNTDLRQRLLSDKVQEVTEEMNRQYSGGTSSRREWPARVSG